jgi:hypothetical protein
MAEKVIKWEGRLNKIEMPDGPTLHVLHIPDEALKLMGWDEHTPILGMCDSESLTLMHRGKIFKQQASLDI